MGAISFTSIFDIVNIPLGFVLRFCYQLTHNYGFAIILFTVLIRVVLLPLSIKQQKSMANTVRLQPKLQALQKKYANDRQKLGEEQMKLYQEEGSNPMGGCLPLLVQLPILYGLYQVIYHPLRYIVQMSTQTVNRVVYDLFPILKTQYGSIFGKMSTPSQAISNTQVEIYAAKAIPSHLDKLSFLPHNILTMNFNFAGLDLSVLPGLRLSIYLIIPILCYVSSFVQIWMSMRINKQNNVAANAPGTGGMNAGMMIIMPLMSTWIAFSVPAGVGLYWIISNLIMLLQVVLLNKFYNPKELAEVYEQQSEQRKQERIAKMKAREQKLAALQQTEIGESTGDTVAEPPVAEKHEEISANEKLSNSKKKEEDRRRLAASRAKEQNAERTSQRPQTTPPGRGTKRKKKKRK